MPYPTESDLTAFLGGFPDFTVPSGFSEAGALATAIREWESKTGWRPFLMDSVDRTEYFNSPTWGSFGCVLDLRKGLLSTTSIVTGLQPDGSGGEVATFGTHFLYEPFDGGTSERPYTSLRFLIVPPSGPRSVEVIGKFGYSSECPADVSAAILARAAAEALPVANGPSGAAKRIKQGPVEIERDTTAGRDTRSILIGQFEAAVRSRRGPWL